MGKPVNEIGKIDLTPKDEPYPWLDVAYKELGEKEIPGTSKNNPDILKYGTAVTYNGGKPTQNDEVPWCAMFVSWCLQQVGYKDTNSALAASYDKYGVRCDIRKGCIVTIRHAGGGRHVTFCWDPQPDSDHFISLGGNEANSVKHTSWPKNHIVSCRWPVK